MPPASLVCLAPASLVPVCHLSAVILGKQQPAGPKREARPQERTRRTTDHLPEAASELCSYLAMEGLDAKKRAMVREYKMILNEKDDSASIRMLSDCGWNLEVC